MHTETQKSGNTVEWQAEKENNKRLLCWVYIRKPQNKPVDLVAAARETATKSSQTEVIILPACLKSQSESSNRAVEMALR